MEREQRTPEPGGVKIGPAELILRARRRTAEELSLVSCQSSPSYAAAIAGNTPYATLPNGMTIVMRKCNNRGC